MAILRADTRMREGGEGKRERKIRERLVIGAKGEVKREGKKDQKVRIESWKEFMTMWF